MQTASGSPALAKNRSLLIWLSVNVSHKAARL